MRIGTNAFVLSLALCLTAPAMAQYIPPHSNDPHPPANQPSYQLQPSPLARPGVAGYPNAPYSNDPYYTKTVPQLAWPTPPPGPSARFPSIPPQYTTPPLGSSTPRAFRGKTAKQQKKDRTISLQQCYRNWDPGTRMSRASWDSTCRRMSVDGRVAIW